MTGPPVLEIRDLSKAYGGLRPLRIRHLAIEAGERVAVRGIDAGAAELLVNLVTGATLADQGEVRIEGRSTADIADGDEWLASLDRFGLVSSRAVLLEGATVAQNLAMPFTLAIDPVPADVRDRVVALAIECGLAEQWLDAPAGALPPDVRVRAHLGRAVALEPRLLIVEHPTADVPPDGRAALAADIARVADIRRLATLIVTMDGTFAAAAAHRALELAPATGELRPVKRGWFW
jgi:ABC-type transporter Mla maintaining outer membrane lipid asymmetry ATPase subunit MlaF